MIDDLLHIIQRDILNILLYSKEARFTDLNIHKLTNDHFSFHVKKLIKQDLIEKNENGNYQLTVKGKAYATSIDFKNNVFENRQKIIALVVLREIIDKKEKFLIQQRYRQPYFNYFGFPTIRIARGQRIEETTRNDLQEFTGFKCDFQTFAVEHKMDYSKENELLEDNIFIMFEGKITEGEFHEDFHGGKNFWMTRDEMLSQENILENVSLALDLLKKGHITYQENTYTVDNF